MSTTGSVVVRIGANDAELQAALARAQRGLRDMGSQMRAGAAAAAKYGAALAAVGAATVAALVTKGLSAVDAQAKLARQVGGTTAAVQGLERAGKLAGVSSSALTSALGNLNVRLGEAQRGTGAAADSLRRLGLDANELSRMDADERLATIADRMRDMGLSSQQVGDELRNLGIRNREMAVLMMEGGDAIRNARAEVEGFGIAVSDVDAAQIEAANDAMTSIGATIQGIANQLSVVLSPYIRAVAERFGEAAKETGGFRAEIERAVEIALRGFGMVANVVRGLQVTLKGLLLVFQSIGTGILSVLSLIYDGWARISKLILDGIWILTDAANKLPFSNINMDGLNKLRAQMDATVDSQVSLREAMRVSVAQTASELHNLAMQDMPADKVEEFLHSVRELSRQAAEEIVKAREGLGLGVAMGDGEDGDDKEAERHRKQIEDRIERIRQGLLTESELRQEQFALNLEALQEAHELELLSEEEYRERLQGLAEQHADRMRQIQEREAEEARRIEQARNDAIFNQRVGFMRNIGKAMSALNRGAFEENKTAARAEAGVSGALGVMEAWRSGMQTNGPHAPFVAAGYAGAAAVNAARMISDIGKQTYGGGSAPSAPDASAPQPAVQAASAPQQSVSISLQGDTFSKATVLSFIEQINEAVADGARLQVA